MIRLRGLRALTWAYLLETWRAKPAIFWNLAFPLFSLIGLSYIFGGGEAERVTHIVPGILTINLIAASFFAISLHMVSLRESEIYRRLRVTPLTALTVVLAHATTALVNIVISAALQLAVAKAWFRIEIRGSAAEVAVAVLLGAFAFIPLGLLVGSVAGDMRTAPALSNLLFFPMMFLSGAALPLYLMPAWMQRVAVLLPATYVVELLQAAIIRGSSWGELALPAAVLILTGLIGFAFDAGLFRWESREPIARRRLLLSLASLAAVYLAAFAGGVKLEAARPLGLPSTPSAGPTQPGTSRAQPGASARVLSGMTILDGSGGRIEHGRVIIDGHRIVAVDGDGRALPAGLPVTDLSGLYLIPGLIDSHVHIGGSAGGAAASSEFKPSRVVHDLQVYLALGITSFVSMTDDVDDLKRLREGVAAGTMRAPRPFFCGPGITAPRGHPARFFAIVPGLAERMTRQVDSADAAAAAVRELAVLRVDFVKLFLEEGWVGDSFPVLPEPALRAAIHTAHQLGLWTTVHVDNDRHTQLAIDAGADAIEHVPPDLSEKTMAAMVAKRVTLTPTLAAFAGFADSVTAAPITDPLALEWVSPYILDSLRSPNSWIARVRKSPASVDYYTDRYRRALAAARRAVAAGVPILAGSDAGNAASFHGPGLLRELDLLVKEGGMTPAAALIAATGAAARRLKSGEIGRIAPGAFADLVVLGADPAKDIAALRDVRAVYFGGVPIQRDTLLSTAPGNWMPGPPGQWLSIPLAPSSELPPQQQR
jgi:imidazolonepropionase-like amidohydrolase/ABC-type polysaccharide/polyol phosphate export permease